MFSMQNNPDLLDLATNSNNYSDNDDLEVQYDEQDIDENNQEAVKVPEETPEEKELKKIREKINKQRQQEDDEDGSENDEENDEFNWKRHFGNNFTCFFSDDEPLFTLGPQCKHNIFQLYHSGQFNICMVFSMASISFALIYLITMKKSTQIYISSILISIAQILAYILCAIINPGIISAKEQSSDIQELNCDICEIQYSSGDIFHCEECNICIQGYERHCMIAGKCIGKGNIIYYYMALGITPIYLIFFLLVSII